jgi:hypothetical protein
MNVNAALIETRKLALLLFENMHKRDLQEARRSLWRHIPKRPSRRRDVLS